MYKFNKKLIESLKSGSICISPNQPIELVRAVLKEAFPNDNETDELELYYIGGHRITASIASPGTWEPYMPNKNKKGIINKPEINIHDFFEIEVDSKWISILNTKITVSKVNYLNSNPNTIHYKKDDNVNGKYSTSLELFLLTYIPEVEINKNEAPVEYEFNTELVNMLADGKVVVELKTDCNIDLLNIVIKKVFPDDLCIEQIDEYCIEQIDEYHKGVFSQSLSETDHLLIRNTDNINKYSILQKVQSSNLPICKLEEFIKIEVGSQWINNSVVTVCSKDKNIVFKHTKFASKIFFSEILGELHIKQFLKTYKPYKASTASNINDNVDLLVEKNNNYNFNLDLINDLKNSKIGIKIENVYNLDLICSILLKTIPEDNANLWKNDLKELIEQDVYCENYIYRKNNDDNKTYSFWMYKNSIFINKLVKPEEFIKIEKGSKWISKVNEHVIEVILVLNNVKFKNINTGDKISMDLKTFLNSFIPVDSDYKVNSSSSSTPKKIESGSEIILTSEQKNLISKKFYTLNILNSEYYENREKFVKNIIEHRNCIIPTEHENEYEYALSENVFKFISKEINNLNNAVGCTLYKFDLPGFIKSDWFQEQINIEIDYYKNTQSSAAENIVDLSKLLT